MTMSNVRLRSATRPSFDAATLQVLWTRLIACVDEAARCPSFAPPSSTLVRRIPTTLSCRDYDEQGQISGSGYPVHPLFHRHAAGTVKHFIKEFRRKPFIRMTFSSPTTSFRGPAISPM